MIRGDFKVFDVLCTITKIVVVATPIGAVALLIWLISWIF